MSMLKGRYFWAKENIPCYFRAEGTFDRTGFYSIGKYIQYITIYFNKKYDRRRYCQKYRGDLEYRLLNGSLSGTEEDEVAKILELNETDELQVITCRLIPKDNAANFNDGQRRDVETIKKKS